jgi:hypothetical protein
MLTLVWVMAVTLMWVAFSSFTIAAASRMRPLTGH